MGRVSAPRFSSKAARCAVPGAITRKASPISHSSSGWRGAASIAVPAWRPAGTAAGKNGSGQVVRIDRQRCDACGDCAHACPSNALEMLGTRTTVQELLPELLKDAAYYTNPAAGRPVGRRAGFSSILQRRAFARPARRLRVHPPGYLRVVSRRRPGRPTPSVDLFLFDLKLDDPALHRRYTGQDNAVLLANLEWLAEQVRTQPMEKELWVRTPVIPGATCTYENINAIGARLAELGSAIQRWELCAFNNLCRDKYSPAWILAWSYQEALLLRGRVDLEQAGEWARSSGVKPRPGFRHRLRPGGSMRVNMDKPALTQFSPEDIHILSASMKIGILGTVTPEGLPHLTMISTLKASAPSQMAFGQFIEGRSKEHLQLNPRAGWLTSWVDLDKQLWRGKADFTHTANTARGIDFYNNTPLFRYNAYFGVHTVYYLDLVGRHWRQGPGPCPCGR